jgi:hypothetical protein
LSVGEEAVVAQLRLPGSGTRHRVRRQRFFWGTHVLREFPLTPKKIHQRGCEPLGGDPPRQLLVEVGETPDVVNDQDGPVGEAVRRSSEELTQCSAVIGPQGG